MYLLIIKLILLIPTQSLFLGIYCSLAMQTLSMRFVLIVATKPVLCTSIKCTKADYNF